MPGAALAAAVAMLLGAELTASAEPACQPGDQQCHAAAGPGTGTAHWAELRTAAEFDLDARQQAIVQARPTIGG